MNEQEYKVFETKISEATAKLIKDSVAPLQLMVDAIESNNKDGRMTEKQIEQFKSIVIEQQTELTQKLAAQGTAIEDLRKTIADDKSEGESIVKVIAAKASEIQDVIRKKTGAVVFDIGYAIDKTGRLKLVAKDAAAHNTTNTAVITQDLSAAAILRAGSDGDSIETINRAPMWLLDFVSLGNTTASSLTYFEETARIGNFAITSEGSTKPLNQYAFKRRAQGYKKAAGRAKLTEEFNMDFPQLVSQIKDLMRTDCRSQMQAQVLADMISGASSYSNAALVGQIDNADDWAAIAAIAGQLGNGYYTPNVIIMNNNQSIVSAALKDTVGQYVDSSNLQREIANGGLSILKSPAVTFGDVIVADASVVKVLLRGDMQVRIGFGDGDFDANMFSLVVEQYFYSYVPEARKGGIVNATLSTVKASIEKA